MSSEMLQVIGLSVDIFGVLLMSYSYFSSTKFITVPWFLLISLFSITKADFDASFSKRLNGEKHGRASSRVGLYHHRFYPSDYRFNCSRPVWYC